MTECLPETKFTIDYQLSFSKSLTLSDIRYHANGTSEFSEACKNFLHRKDNYWCEWPEGTIFRDNSGLLIIRIQHNRLIVVDQTGLSTTYHTDTHCIAKPAYCSLIYYPEES